MRIGPGAQTFSFATYTQDHSFPNNELCLLKICKITRSVTLFMGLNNPIPFHRHQQGGL